MIKKETILNKIHEKLIYLTGNEYILLSNFKNQKSEILKSFNDAYIEMSKIKRDGYIEINDILKKFYRPTNTLLEKIFLKDEENYPYNFGLLDNPYVCLNGFNERDYENISRFSELFEKFLGFEMVKNVLQFHINLNCFGYDERLRYWF